MWGLIIVSYKTSSPALLDGGRHELGTDVTFAERLFTESRHLRKHPSAKGFSGARIPLSLRESTPPISGDRRASFVKREAFLGFTRYERRTKNRDILHLRQFLRAYDQSEARIESQSRAIEGKGRRGGPGKLRKTIVARQNFTGLHV